MPRISTERILVIGDGRAQLGGLLDAAAPGAAVTRVSTVFDGIAELVSAEGGGGDSQGADRPAAGNGRRSRSRPTAAAGYTTILAAAEPIERRPEAAVRALRAAAGTGKLVLFGHPTLEGLGHKMRPFGCDDFLVAPATAADLRSVLTTPNPRLAPDRAAVGASAADLVVVAAIPSLGGGPDDARRGHDPSAPDPSSPADGLITAAGTVDPAAAGHLLLDALVRHPNDPVRWALRRATERLAPAVEAVYRRVGQGPPTDANGRDVLSCPVASPDGDGGTLYALFTPDADEALVRDLLAALAGPVGKAAALAARHASLQRMAITDELTGVYNARYFRHFLQRILEKARQMHFPVTLLLFDIDDFKHYNDQYGHGVGDEILKQTAAMMKRSTREHDLVARIGGDEFAVVFWDKDGPRQPRQPRQGNVWRPPHSPVQVFERFKRLISSSDFTALGPTGQGKLGISAGLAVYPYEGNDVTSLIAAADDALMQGAKKQGGKNCLYIVGGNGNGGNGNGAHAANGNGGPPR